MEKLKSKNTLSNLDFFNLFFCHFSQQRIYISFCFCIMIYLYFALVFSSFLGKPFPFCSDHIEFDVKKKVWYQLVIMQCIAQCAAFTFYMHDTLVSYNVDWFMNSQLCAIKDSMCSFLLDFCSNITLHLFWSRVQVIVFVCIFFQLSNFALWTNTWC